MATVSHLGILPYCLQTRPADANGVEVSKKWATAFSWRVKKFKLTSYNLSANLSLQYGGIAGSTYSPYSTSVTIAGGDSINQWEIKKYNNGGDLESENDLVCATEIKSTRPSFASGRSIADDPEGEIEPVFTSSLSGAMTSISNVGYTFGQQADAVGGVQSLFSGAIPPINLFFIKDSEPDKIFFNPKISGGETAFLVGKLSSAPDGRFDDNLLSLSTNIFLWPEPPTSEFPSYEGDQIILYGSFGGGLAGNITFKISGFADVLLPVYYQIDGGTVDIYEWEAGDTPYDVNPTGSMTFSATIEASEYWPYDPNDGGGPIYNSTTGEQLRSF